MHTASIPAGAAHSRKASLLHAERRRVSSFIIIITTAIFCSVLIPYHHPYHLLLYYCSLSSLSIAVQKEESFKTVSHLLDNSASSLPSILITLITFYCTIIVYRSYLSLSPPSFVLLFARRRIWRPSIPLDNSASPLPSSFQFLSPMLPMVSSIVLLSFIVTI